MTGAKPAVVLLSGGLDSATTLAIAKAEGFDPYAMSFRYGQRHAVELAAAEKALRRYGAGEVTVVEYGSDLIDPPTTVLRVEATRPSRLGLDAQRPARSGPLKPVSGVRSPSCPKRRG